ncbi:dephospho-CoA kinase [Desulfolithobacter sp.]
MAEYIESRPCVIGITGGIGSGKSRVSRCWANRFNLPLIDLDQICRQLLEPGQSGWKSLRSLLGPSFFSGQILDRKRLRLALFDDRDLRRQVDALLHPLARREMNECCRDLLRNHRMVLVEVPLLCEAGWQADFDRVVVVWAGLQTRCARVMQRDSVDSREALQAIESQMDLFEKILVADHAIDNTGPWVLTYLQVIHLGKLLSARQKNGL